jgi:dihydroorotate dehydrogenase
LLYKNFLKPYMFRKDPEDAHHSTIGLIKKMGSFSVGRAVLKNLYGVEENPYLSQDLWGIHFPNPVGLAAGLDKNGEAIPGFSVVGFGFVEIGTLTPRPQAGNELPRLFRLPPDQALINRMGFNNRGAEETAKELAQLSHKTIPVGINIGKNKNTPNEEAVEDYRTCIQFLYPYGDYFVINISSPNTPGLRNLQHGEELKKLISGVLDEVKSQAKKSKQEQKPVLVKLAPDVTSEELEAMVDSITSTHISGIIATNTTLERKGLFHPNYTEAGGLSGRPLTVKSTEVIRDIYRLTKGKTPIIGVGGVFNGKDAYEKICAGASLIQVYTSLIYKGPEILRQINQDLLKQLQADGHTSIQSAIGSKAKS